VDALAKEWRTTFTLRPPKVVVEVGCGTGYVIASAALLDREVREVREVSGASEVSENPARAAGDSVCRFYATDVNTDALRCTRATLKAHGVSEVVEVLESDLLEGRLKTRDGEGSLKDALRNRVDVLVFNPPYVLTPSEEVWSDFGGIASAWAGGKDGREVIDKLLPDVSDVLAPGGTFFLVLLQQNKPEEVSAILESRGLTCEIAASASADEEHLHVMRCRKPS